MAKIDIFLPTYNRRSFLPRAIDCVLRQTFPDWRLLIVNDGGEDVADLIAAVGDPRIVYFNRPHSGKAAQLNFLMSEMSAEYVAYMDDDDDIFPDHLKKLFDAAVSESADFVYSDTYLTLLDAEGNIVQRTIENTADAPYDEIRIFNRINHKQILHAAELLRQIGGYDPQMRILIDFDGIKRLIGVAKKAVHVREVTGDHFLRADAKTGSYSSISGLWEKDPAAAGRSLLRFFEKDPEALARLYLLTPKLQDKVAFFETAKERRRKKWWRRLFSGLRIV